MNLLFPVSVTVSTVVAALLFRRAFAADADAATAAGYTFVATMMTLAILEHWFLVLPLPAAALWGWSLQSHRQPHGFDVEIVAGFLGAGKTSFLRRRLDRIDPEVRTLVLVNDPDAMHLDAALLRGRGAGAASGGTVFLPLARNASVQIREAVARWSPQRIIIEPAGSRRSRRPAGRAGAVRPQAAGEQRAGDGGGRCRRVPARLRPAAALFRAAG